MLQFFRKYQSYFFIVITFVIIISFSFFGTYNTLPASGIRDQVVFTAVDGTDVRRSELDELVVFLSTDSADKLRFGGAWGPNFLNNGVIKNDFLQTGLAGVLVNAYPSDIQKDLQAKLEKEKRYVPYTHPQASFLSAESAWNYFSPDMKAQFAELRSATNAVDPQAFNARSQLFLAEQKFPPNLMRRLLQYQEKQYAWLTPDQNLNHLDMSLFGYHTIEDWFGPRFVRLVAEFIINSSKIAEQKGYRVSKEEAFADLMKNAETSFKQHKSSPNVGVANTKEYFNEQLRLMGIDQNTAIKLWTQVLLSQRLFNDVGSAVFVDTLAYKNIEGYAKEGVKGELYHLPTALQLANFAALQKFEVYLNVISKRSQADKELLALPTTLLSVEEINKKFPELIQKRYLLDISQVSKDALQGKVGIKDMWNWQVDDANWEKLTTKFPELGSLSAQTRDQRFAALDSLDDAVRNQVDLFSRKSIVDAHPEWLQVALDSAGKKEMMLGLRAKGGSSYFLGLDNRTELMQLLDQATLVGKEPTAESAEADSKLATFSSNGTQFYRIKVLDRAPEKEVLTFAEANQQGVLENVIDRQLETYYIQSRSANPTAFQNKDKSWKEFADVKDEVAALYFDKLIKAIQTDYAATDSKKDETLTSNSAAPLRLYSYVRTTIQKLQKDPAQEAQLVASNTVVDPQSQDKLEARQPLQDQWKLVKEQFNTDRSAGNTAMNLTELFALSNGAWTKVNTAPNGDLSAFHLVEKTKGQESSAVAIKEKADEAYQLMSNDAKRSYMDVVVEEIKNKKAISLDYLNAPVDESGGELEQRQGSAV